MSTHCLIAKLNPNKSVDAIYCHLDGGFSYPSSVGDTLQNHYRLGGKLETLFELGNVHSLRRDIGTKHDYYTLDRKQLDKHEFDTAFDIRDCKSSVKENKAKHFKNFEAFMKWAEKSCGNDYIYIHVPDLWLLYSKRLGNGIKSKIRRGYRISLVQDAITPRDNILQAIDEGYLNAYVDAALATSDHNDVALNKVYKFSDVTEDALAVMATDCMDFFNEARPLIALELQASNNPAKLIASAAFDFWLTRNHHGSGFFDSEFVNKQALADIAHSFSEQSLSVERHRIYID